MSHSRRAVPVLLALLGAVCALTLSLAPAAMAGTIPDALPSAIEQGAAIPGVETPDYNTKYRIFTASPEVVEIEPRNVDSFGPGDAAWVDFTPGDFSESTSGAQGHQVDFDISPAATLLGVSWGVRACTRSSSDDLTPCDGPEYYRTGGNTHFTLPVTNSSVLIRLQLTFINNHPISGAFAKNVLLRVYHHWSAIDTQPPTFSLTANGADVAGNPGFTPTASPEGVTLDLGNLADNTAPASAVVTVDGVATDVGVDGGSILLGPGVHTVHAEVTDIAGNKTTRDGTVSYTFPPPVVSPGAPDPGSKTKASTPITSVSAQVTHSTPVKVTALLDGVSLVVDDEPVVSDTGGPDIYTAQITNQPCAGVHTVSFMAVDERSQAAASSWSFSVVGTSDVCIRRPCVGIKAALKADRQQIAGIKRFQHKMRLLVRKQHGHQRTALKRQANGLNAQIRVYNRKINGLRHESHRRHCH